MLDEIKKPVEKELKHFHEHFKNAMKSKVSLLDKITYYIVKRKGKQVRPILVFLSAKLCGDISLSSYNAASLIELLHTATLVHDDVVDDAYRRRGFFSVNTLWKNKIAVLVGDYFLAKGLLLAVENKEFKLLEIVSSAVKAMSEGELLQIEKARKLDIEEDVYYEIIKQKTASLIASACAAGAASVTDDEEVINKMFDFGEKIGISFQIRDDLLDFSTTDIGKPVGIDIKEKKITLPLIYALKNASSNEVKQIKNIIKRHSDKKDKVKIVLNFVRQSGGMEYAKEAMLDYREQAFDIINTFPDSETKESLIKLVHFVTDREK